MKKKFDDTVFYPFKTLNGEIYCRVFMNGKSRIYSINSSEMDEELESYFLEEEEKIITNSEIAEIKNELRIFSKDDILSQNLESRIFSQKSKEGEITVVYNLNPYEGLCAVLKNGCVKIEKTQQPFFFVNSQSTSQVIPDLTVDESELLPLLEKHFFFEHADDYILLSLYLVSVLSGNIISHPILILAGSKGSGKSETARKIKAIVDPASVSLVSIPKNKDDLAIRLSTSHMTVIDNVSYMNKGFADLLAMSVTGGCYTKRALYTDSKEISYNLNSLIILTGIELACKESDVLDRSILLNLERIPPNEMTSVNKIREEFDKDLPKILGCCFKLLANALIDEKKIFVERTRLVDSFELMMKVGRQMNYDDVETSDILWDNYDKVNESNLLDNPVATCFIEFMVKRNRFQGSMTELLGELKKVAIKNNITLSMMPNKPNILSRRLNEFKVELEYFYGIYFHVKNIGSFREITAEIVDTVE